MIKVLEDRDFPTDALRPLASARSAGRKLRFKGEEVVVEELTDASFADIDYALFSAGASISKEFAPKAVEAGALVIDNSSAFRMDPETPLVVPEVNAADAFANKGIIANPNCTTIIMLVALKPLHDYGRVTRVTVATYQSASGAGAKAMQELEDQAHGWVAGERLVVEHFAHQLLFNLIPHIDAFVEGGYTKEELKMVNETRKIMHAPEIIVSPTCVRVPVARAHSEAVFIETELKITVETARKLFEEAPGIALVDEPEQGRYPMPLDATGGDDCFVGRIREDLAVPNGLNFWVVGDQLRKGAALNAVQIAELFAVNAGAASGQ
ncbi:MAG: aspartate-semialdehyde dehydrogenase [Chloroflexi bacterium]|nr:aspartate-semialdehyde dehydrogenase [Chloroflexota bacterium]